VYHNTLQYITVHYTVYYSIVQYIILRYITVHNSILQYITVTVQTSILQYITVHYYNRQNPKFCSANNVIEKLGLRSIIQHMDSTVLYDTVLFELIRTAQNDVLSHTAVTWTFCTHFAHILHN